MSCTKFLSLSQYFPKISNVFFNRSWHYIYLGSFYIDRLCASKSFNCYNNTLKRSKNMLLLQQWRLTFSIWTSNTFFGMLVFILLMNVSRSVLVAYSVGMAWLWHYEQYNSWNEIVDSIILMFSKGLFFVILLIQKIKDSVNVMNVKAYFDDSITFISKWWQFFISYSINNVSSRKGNKQKHKLCCL